MAKLWKEMSREELLDEKSKWEANLQKTNQELGVMRRRAASTGSYGDNVQYEALLQDRLRYIAGHRGVCTQLSKFNALNKSPGFDTAFRKVAKLILEEDLYEEIFQGAREMVDGVGVEA